MTAGVLNKGAKRGSVSYTDFNTLTPDPLAVVVVILIKRSDQYEDNMPKIQIFTFTDEAPMSAAVEAFWVILIPKGLYVLGRCGRVLPTTATWAELIAKR